MSTCLWGSGASLQRGVLYTRSDMKLYCFQPQGRGELSAFVMAASEQSARDAVKANVEDTRDTEGFDTNYYKVTVLEPYQVAWNDND